LKDAAKSDWRKGVLAEMIRGDDLKNGVCILLVPAVATEDLPSRILTSNPRTVVLLPEIDKDGQCAVWEKLAAGKPDAEVVRLKGVGTQVDWAWEQVVELVRGM